MKNFIFTIMILMVGFDAVPQIGSKAKVMVEHVTNEHSLSSDFHNLIKTEIMDCFVVCNLFDAIDSYYSPSGKLDDDYLAEVFKGDRNILRCNSYISFIYSGLETQPNNIVHNSIDFGPSSLANSQLSVFQSPLNCLNTTILSIKPDTTNCSVQSDFEISINIAEVENLFAVAFDLVYDTNFITFDSIEEGNFLNENGQSSTIFIYSDDPGRVIVAISRMNYQEPGVTTINDTAVARAYFTAINPGFEIIQLENIGLFDPELNNIPFFYQNGFVKIPGPPTIYPIPDTSIMMFDTLFVHLNELVSDPDTPPEQLIWEVLSLPSCSYFLDSQNQLLKIWSDDWYGITNCTLQVCDPEQYCDQQTFEVEVMYPTSYSDSQNNKRHFNCYPVPFDKELWISFFVPEIGEGNVEIKVYPMWQFDELIILNQNMTSGKHRVNLLEEIRFGLPKGVFIIELAIDNEKHTQKLISK